jgi:hypothetical protein
VSRAARTAAAFALLLAAFGVLAALLMPAPAAHALQEGPAPAAEPQTPDAPADAFLTALVGPGTDLTPQQAADLTAAADRVCEGFYVADVPVAVMTDGLMRELTLTGEEARHLIDTATAVRCTA